MRILFLALIMFNLVGCAVKKGLLFENKPSPVNINYKSSNLILIDLRGVEEGNIDLPFMSFPGQSKKFYKRFPDEQLRDLFDRQIVLNTQGEGHTTIIVTTLMADQYFFATVWSEIEGVVVKLLVTTVSDTKTCEASKLITGQVSSFDASTSYINSMLEDAIVIAFNEAVRECS